jgi:membrane associated rhomboid family serine protease
MYVLYLFGETVENYFGAIFNMKASLFFVLLYTGAVAFSSLPSYGKHKNHSYYNAVGASGAVSAVVFASILFDPMGGIGFLFLPGVNIPAFIFGILYLLYSWYMAKKGKDNIGHDAHFWGAVFGFVFTIILKPVLAERFIAIITGHYFE